MALTLWFSLITKGATSKLRLETTRVKIKAEDPFRKARGISVRDKCNIRHTIQNEKYKCVQLHSLSIQPYPQTKETNSITRNNLSTLFQLHITDTIPWQGGIHSEISWSR
ncbi:hypothetical protein MTR_3g083005 [Medicago truncatula]|uniref:Uncharacterized protein n=1 Tax=Medicago truncatula TaxID=3880 RepID=A0A072V0I9_MEDTR|nr:hypothetical protein MTR_3g083005 [Medicago truncatula]